MDLPELRAAAGDGLLPFMRRAAAQAARSQGGRSRHAHLHRLEQYRRQVDAQLSRLAADARRAERALCRRPEAVLSRAAAALPDRQRLVLRGPILDASGDLLLAPGIPPPQPGLAG